MAVDVTLGVLTFVLGVVLGTAFVFKLFNTPGLNTANITVTATTSELVRLTTYIVISFLDGSIGLGLAFVFVHDGILFNSFIQLSLPTLKGSVS